ncbi:MAG: polysaccharide deacetylase family protein [Bacteroidota bacterium]
MLHIFSSTITNRLKYSFDLVFNTILRVPYALITDLSEFEATLGPKLAYHKSPVPDCLFVPATGILFETDIRQQDLSIIDVEGQPAFFGYDHPEASIPFDLFGLVFYLTSRYEEYLPTKRDEHDRYPASQSLAYQGNFLELPLVNIHVRLLRAKLNIRYPDLEVGSSDFRFQPTFDIDYAWTYKHKGLARTIGATLRDMLSGNLKSVKGRISTLTGNQKDPFETYETIFNWHLGLPQLPIFFFLVGKYGKYDKNISPDILSFRELIKGISQKYPIGLHPSYGSHINKNHLIKEQETLSSVTNNQIKMSRQHFLKFRLPETYRQLESIGITHEYSMGYAETVGFRASIATPFKWFDLDNNRVSEMTIHPFQVMDVTLNQYMELSPKAAIKKIHDLVTTTRNVGGEFCSLWHNNSLCFEGPWKGWDNVYPELINACMVE